MSCISAGNPPRPHITLEIIAAMDESGGIGLKGSIPWHVQEDLAFFKAHTMGHPLVMGRKTFESLGSKPLPGRPCAVWTHHPERFSRQEHCHFSANLEALIQWCARFNAPIEAIGGTSIYEALMPRASRLLISRISGNYGCDVFFPEIKGFKRFEVTQMEGFILEIWQRVPE